MIDALSEFRCVVSSLCLRKTATAHKFVNESHNVGVTSIGPIPHDLLPRISLFCVSVSLIPVGACTRTNMHSQNRHFQNHISPVAPAFASPVSRNRNEPGSLITATHSSWRCNCVSMPRPGREAGLQPVCFGPRWESTGELYASLNLHMRKGVEGVKLDVSAKRREV